MVGSLAKGFDNQGLGRNITFRVFEQKVKNLWHLNLGCEIIDMEQESSVVRFYCREDYIHVLEEGPWIVMGYYLKVTR